MLELGGVGIADGIVGSKSSMERGDYILCRILNAHDKKLSCGVETRM